LILSNKSKLIVKDIKKITNFVEKKSLWKYLYNKTEILCQKL
jgi:hypothetical protein